MPGPTRVKRLDDGGQQTRSTVTLPAELEALVLRLMTGRHLSRSAAIVEIMWSGASTITPQRRVAPKAPIITTEWLAYVHKQRDKISARAAEGKPLGYSGVAAAALAYGPGRGHTARQDFRGALSATAEADAAYAALVELTLTGQLIAFPCTPEIAFRAAAMRQEVDLGKTPKQLPGREYMARHLLDAISVVTAAVTGNQLLAADRPDILALIDYLPKAERPEILYPGLVGFVHVRNPLSSR